MNISGVRGSVPQNMMFAGNMLKSTREKVERRQECENKVAFYEDQILALKEMNGDSLEDISRKLELLHSYQDYIAAAKHEYNSQQMFHAMDEAREQGEKIAEAVEEHKPKTAEERRREAVEEVLGTEGNGLLSELMEEMEEMTEHTEEMTKQAEEMMEQMEQAKELEAESLDVSAEIEEEFPDDEKLYISSKL